MSHSFNQRGISQAGILIILAVIALLGATGGWLLSSHQGDDKPANASLKQTIKNARCDYRDEELCRFFTSWKTTDHYTITADQHGSANPSHMTIQSKGDNTVMVALSGNVTYEAIVIGDTTYVKDTRDNSWWKQAHNANSTYHAAAKDYTSPYELVEPTPQTMGNFSLKGKEACGTMQCFKYQITNPDVPDDKQFIWFDDQDYQLRKMQTSAPYNTTFNATFSYQPVDIKAPYPTKELPVNQYIIPGQNEPVTIPAAPSQDELNALMGR